jgi:hypothetical protein
LAKQANGWILSNYLFLFLPLPLTFNSRLVRYGLKFFQVCARSRLLAWACG